MPAAEARQHLRRVLHLLVSFCYNIPMMVIRSARPPISETPGPAALCVQLLAWWLWLGIGGLVALNLLVATPLLCVVDCAVHVNTHTTHRAHPTSQPAKGICCVSQPVPAHMDDLEACYPMAIALIALFVFWGVCSAVAPDLPSVFFIWPAPPPFPPPRY